MTRAPCPSGASPIASYSISSAMVKQSCVSTNERSVSARPALASARCQACGAALELEDVALRHRQEVLHVRGGAERDRLAEPERGLDVGQHDRGGAVGDERAVGALERARRRADSSRSRCGRSRSRDPCASARRDCRRRSCGSSRRSGERVGLVAPALEIESGDLAEDARRSRPRCRPPRARRRP